MTAASGATVNRPERFDPARARFWWAVCAALIGVVVVCLAIDAGFDRSFQKNITDGVAYLDIRDAVAHGNMAALLNAYWSPAYPVALFAGLAVLGPSPAHELPAIHAIGAAIGLLALGCLVYFVAGIAPEPKSGRVFGLSRPVLPAAACALFLLSAQQDVPVLLMTPDLLLAAFLWLAGGAFLRITLRQRLLEYALLAVAVSFAYFTKAVGMSVVMLAFLLLPFAGESRKKAIRGLALYAAVVAVLVAPYVAALSKAKGRFTFGESGGLNYAWIVDGADSAVRWNMQNDSPHGHAGMRLTHPAARLLGSPDVYEFGSPIAGTFPIFDDPSYWDDGVKRAFYLKGQLWHLVMNTYHTAAWLAGRGAFVVALLLLLFVQWRSRTRGEFRQVFPVPLWFAGMWGLYMLVDVENRYVFAVFISIILLTAASVRLPASETVRRVVAVCALVLVCGVGVRALDGAGAKVYNGMRTKYVGHFKQQSFGPFANPYWEAAQTLRNRLGLRPNDSVACMQLGCDNTYWARLLGLKITADVSGLNSYWDASAADRAKAMAVLAGAGVKAVVARNLGPGSEAEGWIPLTDPNELPAQGLYARLTKP